MALESQLHELVALTLGVANGEVCFSLAVGGADDIGGLVDTALELAFVTPGCWVGVDGVNRWIITCLSVGRVCAVRLKQLAIAVAKDRCDTYTIESIKESVEQVGSRDLFWLINLIVDLVQSHRLRIDQCEA
jgi:hypothetical protein